MKMRLITCLSVLLLSLSAEATNYTVKAGGGGNYTTIQACATAMSAGDTCTVYAGTYNESPRVTAGAVGNYKTITANGSDIVSVLGFTLGSHTQLIGNCPTLQGTVTSATCGFFISNTASPTTNCVSMANGTTDVYIRFNVMYACGGIGPGWPAQVSYIYMQGNTISYTNSTTGTLPTTCGGRGSPVGNSVNLWGNHILVENNDLSHFTISLSWNVQYSNVRDNSFHDTNEVNNAGNCHSDTWFSEPGVSVNDQYNVYEGNTQSNGIGPNAKGILAQNESCGGTCYNIIERFNIVSRIGGGVTSNDANPGWPYFKVYNNTFVDPESDITDGPVTDNHAYNGAGTLGAPYASELNNIFYYSGSTGGVITAGWNPYGAPESTDTYGYNLVYCPYCTTIYGHTYESRTWTGDPGNKNANPLFVNYVGPGSPSNNYHLQSGSPAIAAGTYLATVASGDTGAGTSLVVTDASFFQDGYGLTNAYSTVQGDCIAVGTASNHVCVTSVNYSTNTLTLAGSISRSAGQAVYLYSKSDGVQVLTGTAPDIGAFSTVSTGTPAPPTGLTTSVN